MDSLIWNSEQVLVPTVSVRYVTGPRLEGVNCCPPPPFRTSGISSLLERTLVPEKLPNPPDWISECMWKDLLTLLALPAFTAFTREFWTQAEDLKIFDSASPTMLVTGRLISMSFRDAGAQVYASGQISCHKHHAGLFVCVHV